MTHSHVLELAGRLAQHGTSILSQCRGIPVAALRRYLKARKNQCDQWSAMLVADSEVGSPEIDYSPPSWDEIRPILEEIATSGILVRVASTVLHGTGARMDIPLAIDVAAQSARVFDGVVQRAMGLIAVRTDLACSQLVAIERLGQMADRVSDLLCGALLPLMKCDRYLVDRERARDFAETFGRDPNLVCVPVQQLTKRLPRRLLSAATAREVEQSLVSCLPALARVSLQPSSRPVSVAAGPKMELRLVSSIQSDVPTLGDPQRPISFPTHSFARSLRRLRDSARE